MISTLLDYPAQEIIDQTTEEVVRLPALFSAKQARSVKVKTQILGWNSNESTVRALTEMVTDQIGRPLIHKYTPTITIEDVNGNLFDSTGRLRNREEMNLRFLLQDHLRNAQHGITKGLVKHLWLIFYCRIKFAIKRMGFLLGLTK